MYTPDTVHFNWKETRVIIFSKRTIALEIEEREVAREGGPLRAPSTLFSTIFFPIFHETGSTTCPNYAMHPV